MNGNTQFGTASPNGNTTVNGWLDQAPLSAYSAGVVSGFAVSPVGSSGFNLHVGGTSGVNDFAVIKNQNGDSDTVAGNTGTPYTIAIPSVPGTSGQSQVNSIIIYKDPTLTTTIVNGVDTIGLAVIQGTAVASGSQVAPTDATIRAGITNGSVIFYTIIANVTLTYGATGINATNITQNNANFNSNLSQIKTKYEQSFALGYGRTGYISRDNDTVILEMPDVVATLPVAYASLSEQIPSGYRPRRQLDVNYLLWDATGVKGTAVTRIFTNGSMANVTSVLVTAQQGFTATWKTSDTFPS